MSVRRVPGKVVNGRVEVEFAELPEGAEVLVFVADQENGFVLTPEEEAELEEAMAESEEGDIDADEAMERLRNRFAKA